MKNIIMRSILIMLLIMMIFQIQIFANTNNIIIKKDSEVYSIYVKDALKSEFEFAFSNEKNATNLNYINSIKDSQGNNIAYMDIELEEKFAGSEKEIYMWVKKDNKIILEGTKIDFESAKTDEQLLEIKNITKKIKINSVATEEKIKIDADSNKKYYYKFETINSSEEYKKLNELVEEMEKFTENTNIYTKLSVYDEFYDLYNEEVSKVKTSNWNEAKDLEIEKPYDPQENQKYILWLKDEKGEIDFQILTAYKENITDVEEKEIQVEVVSKLPISFDKTTNLYIALVVVVIAIIIMIIIRKNISNENKRK